MSERILKALRQARLIKRNGSPIDVARAAPNALRRKLEKYYAQLSALSTEEVRENSCEAGSFGALLSSVSSDQAVDSILPSCFVYDRVFADDPVARLATPKDAGHEVYNKQLGLDAATGVDRSRLADALDHVERLSPLLRLGTIGLLSFGMLRPDTSHGVPIYFSENGFRSEIPEHIHDFVHDQVVFYDVSPSPNGQGLRCMPRLSQALGRGIQVQFAKDAPSVRPPFYILSQTKVLDSTGDGHFTVEQKVDWDEPPDRETYNAWLYQSVNRTAINRLQDVSRELNLANGLNATYVTESEFEATLCGLSLDDHPSSEPRHLAVNFLSANAPYLKIDNPKTLAALIAKHPHMLRRWHDALLAVSDELNGCSGDFSTRARMLFAQEVQPQIDELENTLSRLSFGMAGSALLAISSIGLALLSDTSLPLSALLGFTAIGAAGRSLPSVAEYIAVRNRPAFIWKRLSR